MDRNDRQAIEDLFAKLAEVERSSPQRDAASEAFIRQQLARQPGAPYYMAQTIVVQEQALAAAERRIEELETRQSGGADRFGSVPSVNRQQMPGAQPGGFLAGAAQTALGVAGGWLLGNAIGGMFGSDKAQAAESGSGKETESAAEEDADEAEYEQFEDDGGDAFGDFGDFDA